MQARVKAETFFKEGGKKTEDALKHAGESVHAMFTGVEESLKFMGSTRHGWFSGDNAHEQGYPVQGYPVQGHHPHPAAAVPGAPQAAWQSAASPARAGAAPPAAQAVDDAAMRRHCAALERMVEIGLSPQAARVSLRHLDAWLVSQDGEAEMAAAEVAAEAAGEPILHVGDRVRLEGLVKNTTVNGMVGKLVAYGADSIRWKVTFTDGQSFWVRPKLLKPLETRQRPGLASANAGSAGRGTAGSMGGAGAVAQAGHQPPHAQQQQSPATAAAAELAVGWASLEARQAAWNEVREAREIELLEKEEALRKLQDALEAQQLELGEQAVKISERQHPPTEQHHLPTEPIHAAPAVPKLTAGEVEKFSVARQQPPEALRVNPLPQEDCGGRELGLRDDEGAGEEDEMWDMDWTKLAGNPNAASASVAARKSSEAGRVSPRTDFSTASGFGGASTSSNSPSSSCAAPPASFVAATDGYSLGAGRPRESPRLATSSPRTHPRSSPRGPDSQPGMPTPERKALQCKLEAKRRLADMHNGEDFANVKSKEFNKGRMPGVHPDIAQKLEERRRKIEMEEKLDTPVAAVA